MSNSARRVVVTGGGKGIGRAIVARFVAAGDRVVAIGRDATALADVAATLGSAVTTRVCDVTIEPQVDSMFAEIGAPVDVLVNNAGAAMSAPLPRTSLADWRAMHDANATSAFLCTRAVLPAMREAGTGRIIFVASMAGLTGAPYIAAYAAAKHAVVGLMRAVAAEVAGTGVTANAVCPTYVRTEMVERTVANIVATTGRDASEALRSLERTTPHGRLLEPEEVADAVADLAADESASINGEALVLDGAAKHR